MKFSIKYHKVFKKDLKPFKNDSALIAELRAVIVKLANDEILEPKYKDHALKGDFIGTRECHIKGDALLIYEKKQKYIILVYSEHFGGFCRIAKSCNSRQ